MPIEQHSAPRKLHLPLPILWGLTMPQLAILMGVFLFLAVPASSLLSTPLSFFFGWGGILVTCYLLYFFLRALNGLPRSCVSQYLRYLSRRCIAPMRYSGRGEREIW